MRIAAIDRTRELPSPKIADVLFRSWVGAIVFLPVRLYFGYEWAKTGWEKVNDGWLHSTKPLAGFAAGAVKNGTTGDHPAVAYTWWADFLRFIRDHPAFTGLLAKVVTLGELAIGVGLIIGAFTGLAAFFGATLNLSFMLSGSAGVNPAYIAAMLAIVAAWRVAGWIGADAYLLDRVGTVRQPGRWFAGHGVFHPRHA